VRPVSWGGPEASDPNVASSPLGSSSRRGGGYGAPLPLGRVLATPKALKLLVEAGGHPFEYLARHATGDWGDLCACDRRQNELALREGYRVLSSYLVGGGKVWIITEADRSITTILLPEEY
jgi:hypothetical protein